MLLISNLISWLSLYSCSNLEELKAGREPPVIVVIHPKPSSFTVSQAFPQNGLFSGVQERAVKELP